MSDDEYREDHDCDAAQYWQARNIQDEHKRNAERARAPLQVMVETLKADLAACQERAARAEQQNEEYEARVLSHTTRLQQHVEQLQRDLAAARGEREALREALRICYEYAHDTTPMLGTPEVQQRRASVLNAARAALENSDG